MVTVEKNKIAQNEQNLTLESGAETSKKNKEIDEAVLDSQKDQEILGVNQDINVKSQNLEEGVIDSNKNQAISTMEQSVKTDTQVLEQEVKTKTPIDLANEEIVKIEAIKENNDLKKMANIRITKCKSLLDWLKWDRESKRDLKDKVNRAVRDMETIINDEHVYETKQNEYKDRLCKIIYDYYTNREPARQLIMMWKRVPVINWSADTKREAKRDKRHAKNNAEYQIDVSKLKKNTALYAMIWVNAEQWWDYCDFIWQWWIATGHPVFVQNTAGFNNIKMYSPDIYRALTPEWQVTYNTYCQRNPNLYPTYCRNNYPVDDRFNNKIWRWLADIAERIGLNKDHDPRKRQAWEKAGSIAALGWAVVLWFNFLKNLFSSKKNNPDKRRNAWLYWWWLLALLNLDKITNWAQDITWWHPAEKTRMLAETFNKYSFSDAQAMEIADTYVSAPVTTMSALHFIPIYELETQKILEDKDGDFEFNYDNYKKYVDKYAWDNNQKEQVLKAWQQLRDKKCVWAWLRAFWIATRDKLRDLFGSDKNKTLAQTKEVQDWWENMVERVRSWVNKELYNHWLKAKNPEAINTIMSEYGDWQKSKEEVNKLILDWMRRDLLELTSEDGNYTVKEMLTKTEYTSQLNLEEMTMNWFKNWANEVKFTSYGELFEAVYITERIKYIFKWRSDAKDAVPFHVNLLWQIEFNNREWYELHKDTTVVSLKKLKIDLPTIKNNVKAYNDYLNERRRTTIYSS